MQKKYIDLFINPAFGKYYDKYPVVFVDIGASGGLEKQQELWNQMKKHLKLICFEPDERSDGEFSRTGLYKDRREMDFYLYKEKTKSSLLKPNTPFLSKFNEVSRFKIEKTIKINVDTLDNQLAKNNVKDVDYIKLDTQGSEFYILEGSKRILENSVFGLEIEMEFVPLYKDQPLFSDIDHFLRPFGFQPFDMRTYHYKRKLGGNYGWKKGQMLYADTLYFRSVESMSQVLNILPDDFAKKSKVLKMMSIAFLYGYIDYGFEIFNAFKTLFSAEEQGLIQTSFNGAVRPESKIPKFPGRKKLAKLFFKIWRILQVNLGEGKKSSKGLGNIEY